MKRKLLLLIGLFFHGIILWAQSPVCATSDPFCTSNVYTFPAGVNSGTAESGANYGCLTTRPNPAWYHMRILTPGFLQIYMFSTPLRDIDFICWGPFDDPVTPCVTQLTSNKIIDCSYSPNPTEYVDIPNAIQDKYYILLITNYSNQPCNITFQKSAGVGETDCSILPPPVSSNSPVCVGQQIELFADFVTNATYNWNGPSGFSSSQQNPVISNAQLSNAGDYTLIINVNGNLSEPAVVAVEVFPTPVPDFTFTSTCFGDSTFFTDISTTLPAGQQITSWLWDFGDGSTSDVQNPVHYYGSPGTYTVSLKTYTALMMCEQTKIRQVVVFEATQADAGVDTTIFHGWYTTLNGSASEGSGSFTVHWQPEALVQNPYTLITNTVGLTATTVFTLGITDQLTGCINTDQVTVFVSGTPFVVSATAYPSVVCEGQPVQLVALASGGSQNYSFTWTSDPPGFNSQESQPTVTPLITTTYFVTVFDGQNTLNDQVVVIVNPVPWTDAGPDQVVPNGWPAQLSGTIFGASENYSLLWQPQNMLLDPTQEDPETLPLETTTTFILTATDNVSGCSSSDATIVFVSGGILGVMATANPLEICVGQPVQLDANPFGGSGNYTYQWSSEPPGFSSSLRDPLVNPLITTNYVVQVNDGQNQASASVLVTVKPSPLVEAGENIIIPNGWTAQLSSQVFNGSGSYSYNWQPSEYLNNHQITSPLTVPLSESKLFSLQVTDQVYQCTGEDSVMVIIGGSPLGVEVTVSSSNICTGDQIDLLAQPSGGSGLYQYSWTSDPPGFSTTIPNPSDFPLVYTQYYVTVTDGMNTVTGSVTIQVRPRPLAHAGNDQLINVGTNTLLMGSATAGSGQYSYSWQPAMLVENPGQAITKTAILLESVVFNLQVTDQNGCVSQPDEVWINTGGDGLSVFAIASPQVICQGEQTTISAMAYGGGSNYTFSWVSDPPGYTSDQTEFVISPEESVALTVTVDDGFNQLSNSVQVIVNPLPEINLIPNGAIQYGQDTIIVCVRDTVVILAYHPEHPYGTQYFWSNFYAGDRITASTNGNWFDKQTYWVRVTYPETGCQKTETLTILFDFNQCNIGLTDIRLNHVELKVFPNPSDGLIYLSFNDFIEIQDIVVMDIKGKPVFVDERKQMLVPGATHRINLQHVQSGLYTVFIRSNVSTYVRKLVLTD